MRQADERTGTPWLRIVSRCETAESFFSTFARYVDSETIFIATSKPKPLGERRRVVIQLSDGHTMLNGEAEVVESLPQGGGPDGRSGMRLKLLSLEQRSQSVFFELMRRASERRTEASSLEVHLPEPGPAATPLPARLPTPPPVPQPVPHATPPPIPAAALAGPGPSAPEPPAPARVPSSPVMLPANPLSDVSIDDLKGFIECTLFEEGEGYEAKDADVEVPFAHIESVATWSPLLRERLRTPTPIPVPAAAGLTTASVLAPDGTQQSIMIAPPPRSVALSTAIALAAGAALAGALGATVWLTQAAPPPARVAAGPPAPAAEPEPMPPLPEPPPAAPPPAPITTAVYAPTAAAPKAVAVASAAPTLSCVATVIAAQTDVTVIWNGSVLGVAPLRNVAVPCGPATVHFDRVRYDPLERQVTAAPGEPLRLDVVLLRPTGQLEIVTSPAGAAVTVNGQPAGRSPSKSAVKAFETVRLTATLAGHKPWSKMVYVRGKQFRVTAALTPESVPPSRRVKAKAAAARSTRTSDPR